MYKLLKILQYGSRLQKNRFDKIFFKQDFIFLFANDFDVFTTSGSKLCN